MSMKNYSGNSLLGISIQTSGIIIVYVAALIAAFSFAYHSTLALLIKTWFYSADAYHGILVPFISLYFVWVDRERLKTIPIKPSIAAGAALTIAGTFILLFGSIGSVIMLELLALTVIIPGIVLMLFGRRMLRALALPLGYLVLMVPLLDAIDELHRPFQMISATMGALILKALQVPVLQNGLFLELPNIVLEVAVACSGLNFLLSIIAIGIPLAYFTLRQTWQRAALIVLSILIGLTANWFRVALIGIWTYLGGKSVHGPLHVFQGVFVSEIGFVFLFLSAWVIGRFSPKDTGGKGAPAQPTMSAGYDPLSLKKAAIASLVLLAAIGVYRMINSVKPVPPAASLSEFPLTIGQWSAMFGEKAVPPYSVENADYSIERIYRNDEGRELTLYIGYLAEQKQEKELVDYKLRKLYKENEKRSIGSGLSVNRSVVVDKNVKYLSMFWFDANGRLTENKYKAKLMTSLDGIVWGRTNGAIVIISGKMDSDADKIWEDEVDFASNLGPIIREYLP